MSVKSNEIRGYKEREKPPDNGYLIRVLVLPLLSITSELLGRDPEVRTPN